MLSGSDREFVRMRKVGSYPRQREILRKSPVSWDTRYRRGHTSWRSAGLSPVTRRYLRYCTRGSGLLEIGFGAGDDAAELIDLGFSYEGIELSVAASMQAVRRLRSRSASLVVGDFFTWRPKNRYAAVYEKGVFHGIFGRRHRFSFARRVAAVLEPNGLWITVCGSADRYDPKAPRGAVYLTHLVEAVEPFFEILHLEKAKYGLKKSESDFDAWYGAFRLRPNHKDDQ
jgi:hypothetical protein